MVAIVRNGAGVPTGGIHRTYLLDDGSAKRRPARRCSDPSPAARCGYRPSVMTATSASPRASKPRCPPQSIFNIPTWAALSADGLRRWEWPKSLKRVTIFADAGAAGLQAAADLAERLKSSGIATAIISPLHGDDFNDDLQHGESAKDYAGAPPIQPTVALTSVADFEAAVARLSRPPDLQASGQSSVSSFRPDWSHFPNGRSLQRSKLRPASLLQSWTSRWANYDVGSTRPATSTSGQAGRAGRPSCVSISPARPSATKPT